VLAEFAAGFTDSHGLFTFVNVSTRQAAANKIKGLFFYICEISIILG